MKLKLKVSHNKAGTAHSNGNFTHVFVDSTTPLYSKILNTSILMEVEEKIGKDQTIWLVEVVGVEI